MSGSQQEFVVRGYAIRNASSYLHQALGDRDARGVVEQLTPAARQTIDTARSADWCPVSVLSELTTALAASTAGDDVRARQRLVECGEHMGREATNTFFRLVLRMLTVPLFVKKVSDFWQRDHSRGRLALRDLTDRSLTFETFDMAGFNHAVCTSAGFVSFVLTSMGKSVRDVKISGWALDRPCADGASFQLTWDS